MADAEAEPRRGGRQDASLQAQDKEVGTKNREDRSRAHKEGRCMIADDHEVTMERASPSLIVGSWTSADRSPPLLAAKVAIPATCCYGFFMRRFHYNQFSDVAALISKKDGQRVSVCIPTLNEAETIGHIVQTVRSELMELAPLVDELLVIDSGSTDGTREIATQAGAQVFLSADILPGSGSHPGKGENLWKSLHASSGEIICYLDGDISNFHAGFVTGLIGPILTDSGIDYVKAYYERPLARGDDTHSAGGGRVSEILVRPFISLFYPELTPVLQPLSGEYAARRAVLETLPFPTGYGVEIAHLIDLAQARLLGRVAQTDLVKRIHRNRDDGELGDTAFAILRVIFHRLQRDGKLSLTDPLPELHQRWLIDQLSVQLISKHIPEPERPPIHPQTVQILAS